MTLTYPVAAMIRRISNTLTVTLLALAFLTFPAIVAARAAVDIQEITTDKGIKVWLVEDYTVPIISVRFAFKGGSVQDPVGKEGQTTLMTGLFDEGAGDLDADAFQERLDEVGAEIGFSAGQDVVQGHSSCCDWQSIAPDLTWSPLIVSVARC
jgi:zinc protease